MSFSLLNRWLRPVPACVALACATLGASAQAVEPFEIRDIRIEGLHRSDPGSVFGALPFRVGDTYNDDKGASALRALFATGLFKDVRIDVEDHVVVVIVDERSFISTLKFSGLREFDKDTLAKALKESGIAEGMPFDKALIDRAEQEIKRQYLTRSYYGAEVVTTATPIERNQVDITFSVREGEIARIRDLRVVGAKAYDEDTLLGLLDLSASGWMTWYTKSDRYARTKLNADIEKIRSHYLNNGYLEFEVRSTQVTISPDKQFIDIAINIDEGQPYTVSAIKLSGDYLGQEEEFQRRILLIAGQRYRADDVTATIRQFTDLFGNFGYAFARVEPRTEVDRATGQVVVNLVAVPGQRVMVRRINIGGNMLTRDEVIRREFRQYESAWYDGRKIKLSRDRVERLGYFGEVNLETAEVPDAPDQVDLNLTVTEKPTGNLMLSAGFSNAEKLALTASVRKENIFGTGNYLGVELNTSKLSRSMMISTVDPYFTDDGVSRSIEMYYRTVRPANSLTGAFTLATPGMSVRFGVPFTEFDTVFIGAGAEQMIVGNAVGVPNSYIRHVDEFGNYSLGFPITLGWAREERDNPMAPSRGRYQRVNLETSLVGDMRYARLNTQYQQYLPFWYNKLTLGLNAELGMGYGLFGRSYPVFKNFYGGGLGSVRAFESGSLGNVDPTGAYNGGDKRFNFNAELYFPVPGTGNDRSLRFFAFADAGNVWASYQSMSVYDLRASTGFGLTWVSPIGPFKLSWGRPLRTQPGDKIQRFQFQIGTAF